MRHRLVHEFASVRPSTEKVNLIWAHLAREWQSDTTSNRIKFGARYYHPARGRFTQPDPSGQETNTYLYAGANPITNVDPPQLRLQNRSQLKLP